MLTTRHRGFAPCLIALAALAAPTGAQTTERSLAGITLGMTTKQVLARYKNPDQVVVGEIRYRTTTAAIGGGPGSSPVRRLGNNFRSSATGGGGATGGGAPGEGFPGAPGRGGFPGAPSGEGAPPPDEGGSGGFSGQTSAALTRQQEVTWIYNKSYRVNLGGTNVGTESLSYEFLFGPEGRVKQIRVIGYAGPVKTARGVTLGSSYATVVQRYGYPRQHLRNAGERTLNAAYVDANNQIFLFQFLNNKVLSITIATFTPGPA